jgi:hypothetical protein
MQVNNCKKKFQRAATVSTFISTYLEHRHEASMAWTSKPWKNCAANTVPWASAIPSASAATAQRRPQARPT